MYICTSIEVKVKNKKISSHIFRIYKIFLMGSGVAIQYVYKKKYSGVELNFVN